MTESTGALELLRARALGFFTPRPGRRPAPRQIGNNMNDFQPDYAVLAMLGLTEDRIVRVERCASRRVVLMVELDDGSARLVKFPDADAELDNDYERVVLGMLKELELPPQVRQTVPQIVACGDGTRAIALDVVKDCDSLRELVQRDRAVDIRHLVNLAAALAGLHQAPIQDAYRRYPEWLLHPPVPTSTLLTPYEYAHGAGLDFDIYLRAMQELEPEFRELHEQWRPETIVHYDLRDDNILFPRGPGAECPVRLIDWELAGFGDPCFDVGYLVGQFLVDSVRRHGDAEALAAARRNARTFLSAYRALAGIPDDTELRILRYAGVALLLQAAMRLQQLGMLNQVGYLCLLYGKRLIADPTLKVIMK
ncbi:phosphotransferase family protein [Micromonospora eburnea]|uniref:Phosphotransferase enzyme family protein n=1 Tax=Micromonospora eburnea TaxID=227316 RepID=A0A1C6UB03_9ACTN|nr:phosphotransferase [Micromonospora eburnea]SCL51091.1 Phosphotransferase enzyme family protein [Micromonospora eburnea]